MIITAMRLPLITASEVHADHVAVVVVVVMIVVMAGLVVAALRW